MCVCVCVGGGGGGGGGWRRKSCMDLYEGYTCTNLTIQNCRHITNYDSEQTVHRYLISIWLIINRCLESNHTKNAAGQIRVMILNMIDLVCHQ